VQERREVPRFRCRKQQRFGCPWRLGGAAALPFACFLTLVLLPFFNTLASDFGYCRENAARSGWGLRLGGWVISETTPLLCRFTFFNQTNLMV